MKLSVYSPTGTRHEIDVLETSTILHVKDVIAAVSGCNSSTFDLSCNGSSLWIGSSIGQQGISESDVLVMIPVQTGSSACNQLEAHMTDNLANDYPVALDGIDQNSNRFEADLSEFGLDFNEDMNLGRTDDGFLLGSTGPTDPQMIEKLILPSNFEGSSLLDQTPIHHFATAAHVALKIGNDPPSWVHKLEAFSLLANPMLFCVNGINDLTDRRHGSCALVRSSEYTDLLQGFGYNQSDSSAMNITVEKTKKQYKIKNGITLERYEINGDLWTRRRLELSNDSTFSFIQWLETKSKKKGTMKSNISSINESINRMNNTLETVSNDVKSLSAKVTDVETGVQQTQALYSSMSSMVNQLNVSVNALLSRMTQPPSADVDNTSNQ